MVLLATIFIILLALMGTPLFITILLTTFVSYWFIGESGLIVPIEMYKLAGQSTMLTIPLFALAGHIMAESKTPERILRFADALLGCIPGGVSIAALVVCALFTAFTGASGVTIVALGGLLLPMLIKDNYSKQFSTGLVTTSGSLGLLFPPSIPIILYGLVAQLDVEKIFKAGIIPGIFLIVCLSVWSIYNSQSVTKKKFSFSELKQSFLQCRWELLLPIGILCGVYTGKITIIEAAATTAFFTIIMECFIYRDISLTKDMPRIIKEAACLVSSILIILCCALSFTNLLIDQEIPSKILAFMQTFLSNKYAFLVCLNIFLLLVGAMVDIFSAIIVVVPIIIPIAEQFNIHPLHLAIIFLTNMEIGYITPPMGINLFISSKRFNRPIVDIYRSTIPWLVILLFALAVITLTPLMSTWPSKS